MKKTLQNKTIWTWILILGLASGLGFWIWESSHEHGAEAHGHDHEHHGKETHSEEVQGPHGGRLIALAEYDLEVSIFETGMEPVFRLYLLEDGKPVDSSVLQRLQLEMSLKRLGRTPEKLEFKRIDNFLQSVQIVGEPHSFAVQLSARLANQTGATAQAESRWEQIEGRTVLTASQLAASQVVLDTVRSGAVQSAWEGSGQIVAQETSLLALVAGVSGTIQSLHAIAGQEVRAGQLLARIASPQLALDRAAWLSARERLAFAQQRLGAEQSLREQGANAEDEVRAARLAVAEARLNEQGLRRKLQAAGVQISAKNTAPEAQMGIYELRAPRAGVLLRHPSLVGQAVNPETALFELADLRTVQVQVRVPTAEFAGVQIGQKAEVRLGGQGGLAQVLRRDPILDPSTRTGLVVLELPNPKHLWTVGSGVNVSLQTEVRQVPMRIAKSALQKIRDEMVVFRRVGDTIEATPVGLGQQAKDFIEVTQGLVPGDVIVTGNSFLIKADIEKAGAGHDH